MSNAKRILSLPRLESLCSIPGNAAATLLNNCTGVKKKNAIQIIYYYKSIKHSKIETVEHTISRYHNTQKTSSSTDCDKLNTLSDTKTESGNEKQKTKQINKQTHTTTNLSPTRATVSRTSQLRREQKLVLSDISPV
jgi:hypothetical protein